MNEANYFSASAYSRSRGFKKVFTTPRGARIMPKLVSNRLAGSFAALYNNVDGLPRIIVSQRFFGMGTMLRWNGWNKSNLENNAACAFVRSLALASLYFFVFDYLRRRSNYP